MFRADVKRSLFKAVVFISLEAAAFCMITSRNSPQQNWLSGAGTEFSSSVWGFFDGIGNYMGLREKCDSLARENFNLRAQMLESGKESCENSPWRHPVGHYSYLSARVVASTEGSQHNTLILDRGYEDGVGKNDGVITPNGIVGIVNSMTEHHCKVISYLNQEARVSAKLGRDGAVGSLAWNGGNIKHSILTGVPVHITTHVGDTVFSSGFSTIFPPEIPLGRVLEQKTIRGTASEIKVEMFEDFTSVHYVMIVRNNDREEIETLKDE